MNELNLYRLSQSLKSVGHDTSPIEVFKILKTEMDLTGGSLKPEDVDDILRKLTTYFSI